MKNRTSVYILSAALVLCSLIVSIISLINQTGIYAGSEMGTVMVPNDIITLLFAVPVILICMFFAHRGSKLGLICWLGMLYYFAYNYIPYVFDAPISVLLLPYFGITALSLTAMVLLALSINMEDMATLFSGKVPAKFSGGILLALAFFVIAHQSGNIINLLSGAGEHGESSRALYFADFVLAIPLLITGGIFLLRKKGVGYTVGGAMIFGYLAQCIGLIPFFFIQAQMAGKPVEIDSVVAISVMILICAVPFAFFVWGRLVKD